VHVVGRTVLALFVLAILFFSLPARLAHAQDAEITGLAGKCLDVAGGNPASGTGIILWDCHGGPNQRWTVNPNSTIVGLAGKCLDVAGGNPASGTGIILWDCHGGPNQRWTVNPNSTIVGLAGKCLDVAGGNPASGTGIILWDCHGGPNQRWALNTFTQHRLQINRFTTSSLTNADADRILADASTVLQTNDGPGDVACAVNFSRDGNVTAFTQGDGSIDSGTEFNTVIGLPGWVKIVNQINWCGGLVPNVIGCAPVPGNSLAVVRFTANLEGMLWAHEFGHNKGLSHRDDTSAVMNPFICSTCRGVNSTECNAYRTLPATVLLAQAESPQPQQSGSGPMDVRDFVHQTFIHGVSFEDASRYGTSAVPTLLAMLRDPAEEQYWPNIVVVLGMIGDEQAVEPLISFIQNGDQARLSSAHYRAKTSALMSLGYIINKTGNQRALNYLRESASPETWAAKSVAGTAPFQASTTERNIDFSKHAILGLALSGRPEAAEILRTLQQPTGTDAQRAFQAQVSDLVSEALNEHQKISREGLTNYYRTVQP
jgi:hypothetical protein